MRLFIAFPLDGQAAEEAFQWELWLKGRCRQGSFPPKEHLHVTAAFLGECSPWQCTQAKEFVSQFSFFPIPIRFFRWECFHRDTYVLRSDAPEADMVVARLRQGLEALGLPFDRKPFQLHLTLGRHVAFQGQLPPLSISTTLSRLGLFSSTEMQGRRRYAQLSSTK